MKLTTLDFYYLEQCSKRWAEEPLKEEIQDPTRELMRKVLLMKAIGRESSWNFPGIASIWDQIFWQNKDINQQSIRESVQGILAARQLYKRLPKGNLESYSSKNLFSSLSNGILLSSSSDFLLSYPDRYEAWIYYHGTPKRIRRSPLVALEHYLIYQKIRDAHQKPFYLVIYYSSTKRRRVIHFRVRNDQSVDECRKVVYNLADRAKRKIYYPSIGEHCKKCNIKC